jgi:bile acid:Na+ symporter, BASS family
VSVTAIVLAALLVAAMLAVGTTVETRQVRRLLRRPAPVAVALAVNVVLVPGLALWLLWLSDVDGPVAVGVMVAAAAPGGASGALLAHHARGTAALSVSLQALLAAAGVPALPVWLALAASVLAIAAPGLPVGGAAALVLGGLCAQLVPLGVGMWLRASHPAAAERVHAVARRAADVLLSGIVVWSFAANADRLAEVPAAGYAVIAAVVAVSVATYAAPGLGGPPDRSAVAMVTAVRNLSLALFVAGFAADADRVILTVLVYGLLMYAAAAVAVWPMRRRVRGPAAAR